MAPWDAFPSSGVAQVTEFGGVPPASTCHPLPSRPHLLSPWNWTIDRSHVLVARRDPQVPCSFSERGLCAVQKGQCGCQWSGKP